jgi:hypothetical protein
MVCTEYPPMLGGVGRYTYNLTNNLRKQGIEVISFYLSLKFSLSQQSQKLY